jgi:hypothetical protein
MAIVATQKHYAKLNKNMEVAVARKSTESRKCTEILINYS